DLGADGNEAVRLKLAPRRKRDFQHLFIGAEIAGRRVGDFPASSFGRKRKCRGGALITNAFDVYGIDAQQIRVQKLERILAQMRENFFAENKHRIAADEAGEASAVLRVRGFRFSADLQAAWLAVFAGHLDLECRLVE